MPADSGCCAPVLSLTVPVEEITAARHRLVAWARTQQVPGTVVDALALAAYEAMANAAEHAYPDGDGEVTLRVEWSDDDVVTATVADHGHWRPPPDDPGTRGHGLPLIRQLADDALIHHDGAGTSVEMRWDLRGARAD